MPKLFISLLLSLSIFSTSQQAMSAAEIEDDENIYVLKTTSLAIPIYLLSSYTAVVAHEIGHAATVLLLGGKINRLRLYPHVHKGVPILGGINYKASSNFSVPIISIMGVGGAFLSAYFLAPQIPKTSSIVARTFYQGHIFSAAIQFPLYVLFDTFAHWGDMARINEFTGIPTFLLMIPAALSAYVLFKRLDKYSDQVPNLGVVSEIRAKSSNASAAVKIPIKFNLSNKGSVSPIAIVNVIDKNYGLGFTLTK